MDTAKSLGKKEEQDTTLLQVIEESSKKTSLQRKQTAQKKIILLTKTVPFFSGSRCEGNIRSHRHISKLQMGSNEIDLMEIINLAHKIFYLYI